MRAILIEHFSLVRAITARNRAAKGGFDCFGFFHVIGKSVNRSNARIAPLFPYVIGTSCSDTKTGILRRAHIRRSFQASRHRRSKTSLMFVQIALAYHVVASISNLRLMVIVLFTSDGYSPQFEITPYDQNAKTFQRAFRRKIPGINKRRLRLRSAAKHSVPIKLRQNIFFDQKH